jgi:hypothetical protein
MDTHHVRDASDTHIGEPPDSLVVRLANTSMGELTNAHMGHTPNSLVVRLAIAHAGNDYLVTTNDDHLVTTI